MSFFEHLVDLRKRLINSALAIAVGAMVGVSVSKRVFDFIDLPMRAALRKQNLDDRLVYTNPTGALNLIIELGIYIGVVLAAPVVLYQVWLFIAPGLYQHEKKLVIPLVGSSYTLFLCGMSFAYFVVFPTIFRVMAHYNAPLGAQMSTDIDKYLSFALTTFLAFGATFETPIVVVLLVGMGVLTIKKLKKIRPYVVVGAFIVAAVVTPPDVFSQLILAVPLILLYEVGIIAARIFIGKDKETLPVEDMAP